MRLIFATSESERDAWPGARQADTLRLRRQGNDTARAAGFIRPGAIFCAFCTVWLPCLVARCHFHVLLTYIKCSKFVKCTFLSVFADARHITIIKVSTHKIKKKDRRGRHKISIFNLVLGFCDKEKVVFLVKKILLLNILKTQIEFI